MISRIPLSARIAGAIAFTRSGGLRLACTVAIVIIVTGMGVRNPWQVRVAGCPLPAEISIPQQGVIR
jgi:hypothetical protein